MMSRNQLRSTLMASALGLLPMVGCIGASDDKQGSGYDAGTGGTPASANPGTNTSTEQIRSDKGDNPGVGTGTGRPQPNTVDATKTGGLGGTRDNIQPGPGDTGTRGAGSETAGPK